MLASSSDEHDRATHWADHKHRFASLAGMIRPGVLRLVKGWVVSMSRALAIELAKHGITVNCSGPGLVDTPLLRAEPPDVMERLPRAQPMGTLAAADVAYAARFLASSVARAIRGQVLYVCGGKASIAAGRMSSRVLRAQPHRIRELQERVLADFGTGRRLTSWAMSRMRPAWHPTGSRVAAGELVSILTRRWNNDLKIPHSG